eukprot:CAMPEP_0115192778 /NCGR_PEP_ID=MMETSP0270-20121206/13214_1 /TAXON_ID=71861 /ORGANISM="Scrippsiella trochoidea, Strain CCMP3099" /LENGTH=130 /DNA_ID=CAMNT_0002606027 /DNA_START=622 /DNA_END=1015 /DNA_ORIENTATION=-
MTSKSGASPAQLLKKLPEASPSSFQPAEYTETRRSPPVPPPLRGCDGCKTTVAFPPLPPWLSLERAAGAGVKHLAAQGGTYFGLPVLSPSPLQAPSGQQVFSAAGEAQPVLAPNVKGWSEAEVVWHQLSG